MRTPKAVIEDVGHRIRELRKRRGWSREVFAERLELPPENVARLERGHFATLRTLIHVAATLGEDIAALFKEPKSREKSPRGRPPKRPA